MIRALAAISAALLAAAPLPAAAAGPDTARVRIGSGASAADAYVVYPTGSDPVPAVIVVHEWWGLNQQIRDVARRLARQGYVAIVPDLHGGRTASDAEAAHVLSRALDEDAAQARLAAAAAWLRGQPRTAKNRIGVMGFCMGGQLALRFALGTAAPSAVVMFYGTPETGSRVAQLRAPLQAHFGSTDEGIPLERVEGFKSALARAGRNAEVHLYAGAGHAFMNEERDSHNPDAARLAWVRTLAFLQKHLKT